MFLTPSHIILENFSEISNEKELTFGLLENGISIYPGNQVKNTRHYLTEYKNGTIDDKVLIQKLYARKHPEKTYFLKIQDYYVQDATK